MKAIILLEFDDEWLDINNLNNSNIDELLADIVLYHDSSLKRQCDYRQRIYRCFSRLKPMPTTEQIKALLKKGYGFMSFEELLDEILGEEE